MSEIVRSEGLVPLRKKDSGRVFQTERKFTKLIVPN